MFARFFRGTPANFSAFWHTFSPGKHVFLAALCQGFAGFSAGLFRFLLGVFTSKPAGTGKPAETGRNWQTGKPSGRNRRRLLVLSRLLVFTRGSPLPPVFAGGLTGERSEFPRHSCDCGTFFRQGWK